VDVVAWHDGAVWRAAVDCGASGDLTAAPPLADFRVERGYGVWSRATLLSYAINVYEDGDVVSIVTDAGSHGTHVASIVAAHHPGARALDGVAPGAQIVSIKIGDTRLGSMETSIALTRALSAIKRSGATVVNMSYGEPTSWPSTGELVVLAKLHPLLKSTKLSRVASNPPPL
jgi:tripeptidyl-peptidase-2